jgi:predicted enzyme related to lactoylglutathione lyase
MAQPSVQGSFVWQELMTGDTAAAGSFYPKVLGWRSQNSPHSNAYTMFAAASGPIAGMMRLSDELRQKGVPPHWLPYIGADDVDAAVAAAERLGAKVQHAPSDIENNVGRFAVLTDPQGAAFGIYRPGQGSAGPPRGTPAPGQYSWHELATTDAEAAFEFYSKLFGWQGMQRMDMGAAGTYLIFGRDGAQRGGIYKLSRAGGPHWLSYIEVASADAAAAAAREAGAKVVNGPMDVPGGRIVQLTDPAGALFAVHSSAKPAAQPSPEKKPAQAAGSEGSARPAAPKPPKRAEAELPRAGSASSGRGDGTKVTSAPASPAGGQSRPGGGAPAGATARPPSSASTARPPAKGSARPAAAKKAAAKKAPAKKAPAKRAAAKKAPRAKAARKKSGAARAASKRGSSARRAAKKKSAARRPAKSARRAGTRKAAGRSSAKSARRGRRARR